MNKLKNILLLYKNSSYATYFLSHQQRLAELVKSRELERFRLTHDNHFAALAYIEKVLKGHGLKFTKVRRGTKVNYDHYDFIITVGGDGTFLEASRYLRRQIIWGVNSDPVWSVGRFCSGNPENFESILNRILDGKARIKKLNRLSVTTTASPAPVNVLNDVLICHQNPAALSRYYLKIGAFKEEQRSSGIWISTAAGSTGGIHSAGGVVLPQQSAAFEYRPRELYRGFGVKYRLTGGVLKAGQSVEVVSLMREGVVFVDGCHVSVPFGFGAGIQVRRSANPLSAVL